MKPSWEDNYDLPNELDFSKLKRVPNPFHQTFRELNLVSLDDDVKAAFPDSEAVNGALRLVLEQRRLAAQQHTEAA